MIVRLRREYGQFVTSGAQLVLLAVGLKLDSRGGWLACLGLMALVSLFAWLSALRRRRAIADTPTSRVASAAQGYVELRGRGRPLDGTPLVSHLTGLPCLWYRYRVERRSGDHKWQTVDSGESRASFLLDDGSGCCVVDVEEAELLTRHKETWTRDGYRNTEWKLLIGDPVYALGEFATLGAGGIELDVRRDTGELLAEWKKDPPRLLKRFDLDGDGSIDLQEWTLARRAARREVEKQHRAIRAAADIHLMRRPASGQLYLLSNFDPDLLARRYLGWSLFHLTVFFAALAALPGIWHGYF